MARKASPIGPHVLALIEDARVDLARAALAVREGDRSSARTANDGELTVSLIALCLLNPALHVCVSA